MQSPISPLGLIQHPIIQKPWTGNIHNWGNLMVVSPCRGTIWPLGGAQRKPRYLEIVRQPQHQHAVLTKTHSIKYKHWFIKDTLAHTHIDYVWSTIITMDNGTNSTIRINQITMIYYSVDSNQISQQVQQEKCSSSGFKIEKELKWIQI